MSGARGRLGAWLHDMVQCLDTFVSCKAAISDNWLNDHLYVRFHVRAAMFM